MAPEDGVRATATPDFGEVVEWYADFVYNVAYRMLNNQHDAEGAAQDAFLSAHRAWERFKGQSEVSTWLYRITMNACLMRLRKEKRSRQLIDTGYEDQDVPDTGGGGRRAPRWTRNSTAPSRMG